MELSTTRIMIYGNTLILVDGWGKVICKLRDIPKKKKK